MYKELKQLREEEGISQAFMALELGVSRPTYIAIEQGKRELTFNELLKICCFFACTVTLRPEYYTLAFKPKQKREIKKPNPRYEEKLFQKMTNDIHKKIPLLKTEASTIELVNTFVKHLMKE